MKRILIFLAAALVIGALSMMAGASAKTVDIKVNGMTCQDCANKVTTVLHKVEGVKEARVDLEKGIAHVTYKNEQLSVADLEKAIITAGYKTSSAHAGQPGECAGHTHQVDQPHNCGGCPAAKAQGCCPGK